MLARLLCLLGLHRTVSTREGGGTDRYAGKKTAAEYIHVFCYRTGCHFGVSINTATGHKEKRSASSRDTVKAA